MKTALIVTGGFISHPFLEKHYKENAYDYIIGVDSGCNGLYKTNVIPDIIVGDFDSVDSDVLADYRSRNIPELSFDAQKDFTDTELAIKHVIDLNKDIEDINNINNIMILGATGSRIDHMLSTLFMLTGYINHISITLEDENHHIRLLSGPTKTIIKKDQYEYFSLLAISDTVTGITYKNAKYPLNKATLHRYNSLGVSNEWTAEDVVLTFESGICILLCVKEND